MVMKPIGLFDQKKERSVKTSLFLLSANDGNFIN
jgi:hypothetical protein